jgi:CheY-like chemotaxis protein
MSSTENLLILLVEDDPGHARLVEKNLRRSNVMNEIAVLGDGQQAIDYFFGEGNYARLAVPHLVVLDLNLPVLDGYEVLKRLKQDRRTRHIPVIILTTADDAREIDRCYDVGCNICITKPVDYEQFSDAICKLGLFLGVIALPHNGLITYG